MNEPRKSRLVAGVVIVLVFLAGAAVGFFLHHAMLRRGVSRARHRWSAAGSAARR